MTDYKKLVAKLKKKNPNVYGWLIRRGIDLENIHKNTAAFAAAATFILSLPKGGTLPPPEEPIPEVMI